MTQTAKTAVKTLAATILGAAALTLAGCAQGGGSSGDAASEGSVVATIPAQHEVVRIDLRSQAVTARARVIVPGFAAEDSLRSRIYVGSAAHDLVALDARTLAVKGSTPAQGVRDVAVTPDGERIFTLSVVGSSAVLEARDPLSLETFASVAAPSGLATRAMFTSGSLMAIEPSGSRVALLAPGGVYLFDAHTFAPSRILLPSTFNPSDCAFSADGGTLFAGGRDEERKDGRFYAIDVAKGGVDFVVDGGTAEYTAVAPGADETYVTGNYFGLSGLGRVDLAARALMTAIPDDRAHFPTDLALASEGRALVAASNLTDASGAGRVVVFDARTLTARATISLSGVCAQVITVR